VRAEIDKMGLAAEGITIAAPAAGSRCGHSEIVEAPNTTKQP
jgi:hypothetical protein